MKKKSLPRFDPGLCDLYQVVYLTTKLSDHSIKESTFSFIILVKAQPRLENILKNAGKSRKFWRKLIVFGQCGQVITTLFLIYYFRTIHVFYIIFKMLCAHTDQKKIFVA